MLLSSVRTAIGTSDHTALVVEKGSNVSDRTSTCLLQTLVVVVFAEESQLL